MRRTSGCTPLLLNALAVLLAAAFVVALPLAIVAHDVGRIAFSADAVSDVIANRLVEGGAFRRLFMSALFSGEGQSSEIAQALAALDPSEQDEAMRILVPEGWASDQVARLVSGLYAWIDSPRPAPDLSLDLRPLRENLLTGAAVQLVELVVDSWPACTLEQLDQMSQAAAATGEVPLTYCEPSEPFRGLLVEFVTTVLRDQARQMQTIVPLGQDLAQGLGSGDVGVFKEQLRLLRLVARGGWMLAVSILGLIMAVAIRSWKALGRWWGIPLIMAGAACLLIALVGGGLAAGALESATTAAGEDVFSAAIPAVLSGVLDQVLGRILAHALLAAVAGVALLLAGNFLGRRLRPEESGPLGDEIAPSTSEAPATARRVARPPESGDKPSGLFG